MILSRWFRITLPLFISAMQLAHGVTGAFVSLVDEIPVFDTFDTSTSTPIYTIPDTLMMTPGSPQLIVFTPDGSKAFVPNLDTDNVLVINTDDGSILATVPMAPSTTPISIAITPDGTRAYVLNFGTRDVRIIDTSTYGFIGGPIALPGVMSPRVIKITPDGTKAFTANFLSMNVSVITIPGSIVSSIATGVRPFDLAFTPDGTKLYVPNLFGGSVTIINPMTNLVLATPLVGLDPEVAVTTPDSQKAYIANATTNDVSVFSTGGMGDTLLATVPVGTTPITMAVTPDGSKIYTGNAGSSSVTMINNSDYSTTEIFLTMMSTVRHLAITPDGSKVYVVSGPLNNFLDVISTSSNIVIQHINLASEPSFVSIGPFIGDIVSSLAGYQTKNRFFSQTDIINVLTWQAPANTSGVAGYEIYRDAALTDLAGVVAVNQPLKFEDHNRRKGVVYTYFVVSVDSTGGLRSPPISISITP